ncbi:hypothetical protein CXB51_036424 [Gossypium anomalum]|uniref:tRNA-intron lyase n=1 Tax=Gossypium anomalum TaxID=47600 RepID=A0A8J5XVQ0_9ROSI|nr:hypothetical protein CXB51_036424 [Gossypium anomalum]
MADHERRRETMKKPRSSSGVAGGGDRRFEKVREEIMEGEVDDDGGSAFQYLSCSCLVCSEAKASADPMSKIVSQLQSSLIRSDPRLAVYSQVAMYSSKWMLNYPIFSIVPVLVDGELHLKKRNSGSSWIWRKPFIYAIHSNASKVIGEDGSIKSNEELWEYSKSEKPAFPISYKAYSHLRHKNWVVRSGLHYGADFVAYRHLPALIHSEYAVLALSKGDNELNSRLRVWSDVDCTVRLCGNVAKTLLVLFVDSNSQDTSSPSCLEHYTVEEETITRWNPEQSREDQTSLRNQTK